MNIDYLNLGMRLLHFFAAFAAVGGAIFIRFALLPSMSELDPAAREDVHARVRPRWAKIVGMAIGFLLISGLTNYIMFVRTFKDLPEAWTDVYKTTYHMLFGIKFVLALAMFFLASALAGKAAGLQKIRDNARFWINVNLVLALALVVVSGLMRQTHSGLTAPSGYEFKLEKKAG
jgi:uncharacterized membrane protein